MKLKAYIAHSYSLRFDPQKERIMKILKERYVEPFDPFKGEEEILHKYGVNEYYEDPKYKLGREIWIRDLQNVRMCNMLVAWVPKESLGVPAELEYAYLHGKFIQIISKFKHPLFAYVLTGPNQQFETIDDFENNRKIQWD